MVSSRPGSRRARAPGGGRRADLGCRGVLGVEKAAREDAARDGAPPRDEPPRRPRLRAGLEEGARPRRAAGPLPRRTSLRAGGPEAVLGREGLPARAAGCVSRAGVPGRGPLLVRERHALRGEASEDLDGEDAPLPRVRGLPARVRASRLPPRRAQGGEAQPRPSGVGSGPATGKQFGGGGPPVKRNPRL